MKFSLKHTFDATIERYERALFHPALMDFLVPRMPGVKAVEVLEHVEENGVVRRKRRFIPNAPASLPVFARGVKPEMMQWVEDSVYERATHLFRYENVPNIPPSYRSWFVNKGEYRIDADGPRRVRRLITGELTLKVPLIGGIGERLIWKEAERNFESEAKALQEFLDTRADL
ncbi:MAG TPA: DUF2505 family protein [Myxococcota bacterium]|jgi:hypothetical protein|nr:DUF2505 family protein [Myxococcota bacterium]